MVIINICYISMHKKDIKKLVTLCPYSVNTVPFTSYQQKKNVTAFTCPNCDRQRDMIQGYPNIRIHVAFLSSYKICLNF